MTLMVKILKTAFTLIELLVVIAIIGILSGLIIVTMSGITAKANIAKLQVFSNSLRSALMMNIVAQYTFDDIVDYDPTTKILNSTAGNVPDSWADNEGRAYNGPSLKEGGDCVSGKCLSFDSADDYINCGNGTNLNFGTGPFTVILWAKSNVFKAQGNIILKKATYIFNNNAGWGIQYASWPEKLYVGVANGTANVQYNTSLDAFDWMLLGITRMDDNKLYFIKNNSLILLGTLAGDVSNAADVRLGGGWITISGYIDDVRIYNAAVPAYQIREQYYAGLNSLFLKGSISSQEYRSRISSFNFSLN
jgi:prepilin-type N-terminal cleavage/methylation domain-containing protein